MHDFQTHIFLYKYSITVYTHRHPTEKYKTTKQNKLSSPLMLQNSKKKKKNLHKMLVM